MIVQNDLIDAYYGKCIVITRGCSEKETIFVKRTGNVSKDWDGAAFAEGHHRPHLERSYSVKSDDDITYQNLYCNTV